MATIRTRHRKDGSLAYLAEVRIKRDGAIVHRESRTFDQLHQTSHEYKEDIKVGYNLFKKSILLSIWAAIPLLLFFTPIDFFGLLEPSTSMGHLITNTGLAWLLLGVAAVSFRAFQLFQSDGPQSGLVWMTKIFTDPFHDLRMNGACVVRGEKHRATPL